MMSTTTLEMTMTLGDRLSRREADGFAGRTAELRLFEDALAGRLDRSVLLLHGPGGIGKTAMLRAMRRRAEENHREARWITGVSGGLAEPYDTLNPVLLIDRADHCAELLREVHLPRLPEFAVVVIACRRPPEEGWRAGGWERVVIDMPLGGLADGDADALLTDCGVRDEAVRRQILSFAAGAPLALTIAAGAVGAGRDPRTERDRVYAQLGLPLTADPAPPITVEIVRHALELLHSPLALAKTPLARGSSAHERADHARSLLERGIREAFGNGRRDLELKSLIQRRYLAESALGHESIARELSISRATYFRWLHEALERLTTWITAERR